MQDPRRATSSLSWKDAISQQIDIAQTLKAMGLTEPPTSLCVAVKRYGRGWAVYVGRRDPDST